MSNLNKRILIGHKPHFKNQGLTSILLNLVRRMIRMILKQQLQQTKTRFKLKTLSLLPRHQKTWTSDTVSQYFLNPKSINQSTLRIQTQTKEWNCTRELMKSSLLKHPFKRLIEWAAYSSSRMWSWRWNIKISSLLLER